MFVDALGWAAAVFGASVALPQVVRLLRTRTTSGVSLVAWQLMLGTNIAWTSHGFLSGHANVWAPNLIMLCCTLTILSEIRRDPGVTLPVLLGPGLLLGVTTLSIDVTFGSVAFAARRAPPVGHLAARPAARSHPGAEHPRGVTALPRDPSLDDVRLTLLLHVRPADAHDVPRWRDDRPRRNPVR